MKKDAKLSSCGTYRYYLTRQWDENLPFVNFIGLNPSTADASDDDPTIRKCVRYAKKWSYGGIIMTNLFAFCSPYPDVMFQFEGNKIGDENDKYIQLGSREAKISIAVWGDAGVHEERYKDVIVLIPDLHCLKISKVVGQPRHPRFLKEDLTPIKFVSSKL